MSFLQALSGLGAGIGIMAFSFLFIVLMFGLDNYS